MAMAMAMFRLNGGGAGGWTFSWGVESCLWVEEAGGQASF